MEPEQIENLKEHLEKAEAQEIFQVCLDIISTDALEVDARIQTIVGNLTEKDITPSFITASLAAAEKAKGTLRARKEVGVIQSEEAEAKMKRMELIENALQQRCKSLNHEEEWGALKTVVLTGTEEEKAYSKEKERIAMQKENEKTIMQKIQEGVTRLFVKNDPPKQDQL